MPMISFYLPPFWSFVFFSRQLSDHRFCMSTHSRLLADVGVWWMSDICLFCVGLSLWQRPRQDIYQFAVDALSPCLKRKTAPEWRLKSETDVYCFIYTLASFLLVCSILPVHHQRYRVLPRHQAHLICELISRHGGVWVGILGSSIHYFGS